TARTRESGSLRRPQRPRLPAVGERRQDPAPGTPRAASTRHDPQRPPSRNAAPDHPPPTTAPHAAAAPPASPPPRDRAPRQTLPAPHRRSRPARSPARDRSPRYAPGHVGRPREAGPWAPRPTDLRLPATREGRGVRVAGGEGGRYEPWASRTPALSAR